ncbi:MAG TPA: hypothetical protein VF599_15680 [Pyrinomonadaceae bacterium]
MKGEIEANYDAHSPMTFPTKTPTFHPRLPQNSFLQTTEEMPVKSFQAPKKEATTESTGSFWSWVGLGAAVAVGAVAVAAAAAVVAYAISESEETSPETESSGAIESKEYMIDPSAAQEQVINMADGDILALRFHIESKEVDLWNLYRTNREFFEAELQAQITGCFTPDMEVVFVFREGSLWANMVVRVKTAWDSAGRRISTTTQTMARRLNLSEIGRKLTKAVQNVIAKTRRLFTSPIVKGTAKRVSGFVSLASGITAIIDFFDNHRDWIQGGLGWLSIA